MKRAICIVMLVLMGITFAQAQRLLPKKYFLPKEEFRLYYTSTSTVS
ncbi:hypothetical protein AP058_01610 [Flavobacterium sp. TAB 87]|nr:hypothetical protein AP058_01610 [Flavobacterium sp. TAB 87]